jgi:cell wall-associated NlpC family hydrolase
VTDVPQRPVVTLLCAALGSIALTGVGVVAHAAGSVAATTPVASTAQPPSQLLPASRTPAPRPRAAVTSSSDRHRLVDVAVANVWGGPSLPRRVDAPSLRQPAQLDRWLRAMTVRQRRGLTPRLSTQVRYGDPVVVLRHSGRWSRVRIPGQTGGRFPNGIKGWVPTRQLAPRPADWGSHPELVTVTAVKAKLTWVADGATHALTVGYATTLPLIERLPGAVTVELPGTGLTGTLPTSAVSVHRPGTPAIPPSAGAIVAQAERFRGLPYLWAGMSAWGFDCSGLTDTVLGQLGVRLPRDAADQSTIGRRVSRRHLRPGDLVFFSYSRSRWAIHHVAIYAGHGKVIQSPHSGARVQITSLWHSYLHKEYWGATRPLG